MASGADKRKYPRVQARNVSAHLNVADKSAPCVIQNISAGGVFIETRDALPVGMPVAVNLARPGWPRVLKITGRVVWALAEKTAARKGTVPGMRIRFDPLSKDAAGRLVALLQELGAPQGPPPPVKRDSGVITEPVGIKAIQQRLSEPQFPLVRAPDLTPPGGKKARTSKSVPPPATKPDDSTMPARAGDLAVAFATPASEAPRLIVQVQGLLMQLGDLQQQLEQKDREVASLRAELSQKTAELEKSDRELRAAELAIQRLSMQLAARR
jgi:Tfp pilus assembly protein PilZ